MSPVLGCATAGPHMLQASCCSLPWPSWPPECADMGWNAASQGAQLLQQLPHTSAACGTDDDGARPALSFAMPRRGDVAATRSKLPTMKVGKEENLLLLPLPLLPLRPLVELVVKGAEVHLFQALTVSCLVPSHTHCPGAVLIQVLC